MAFGGLVIIRNDAIDVKRRLLRDAAPGDIGGDGGGVSQERIAVTAAALPIVVPNVTLDDRRAPMLARQELTVAGDRVQAIGGGFARRHAGQDIAVSELNGADRGARQAAGQSNGVGHFRPGSGKQTFHIVLRRAMHRIGQFAGHAAAKQAWTTGIREVPAEQIEQRIFGLLILDIGHVGGRVENDATGIDAVGVGSGAGTAPKVAHLGGGERKTVLAGA